jgi:hypothetical protein
MKNKNMTIEEQELWKDVQYRMDAEGFHYCFQGYSHWEDIQDEKFHALRIAYLKAAQELEDYVNQKVEEQEEYDD